MAMLFCAETPAQTETNSPPVGRYEMIWGLDGMYFLDTATGALWVRDRPGKEWSRVNSPVSPRPDTDEPLEPSEEPISLDLPEGGVLMPMEQREARSIPGSAGTLTVRVGDITGGQVFVEVMDKDWNTVAERRSLRRREFLEFKLDEKPVYVQVVELINNLVDSDLCKLRVTHERPGADKKKPKKGKAE